MNARLVSVGNVVIDIAARVPNLPERGGDVLAEAAGVSAGGSFNTMVAAVRQGLPTAYAGAHGTGVFGDRVRAELLAAGIDVLLPPTPGLDTGYDIVLIDAGGERTFVTVFGAEAALTATAVSAVLPGEHDLVHVSGYGLLERTNGAVLSAWLGTVPAGTRVLFDPGPLATDIPDEVWRRVTGRADWLSCNAREAMMLTGETDAVAALRAGCSTRGGWPLRPSQSGHLPRVGGVEGGVVVRLGPDGCLLCVRGEITHVPGFPVAAVDTTGAGDAHAGAFLAALAAGEHPVAAARRANACAALAVTRSGPATAPTRAEVDALLGAGR
ncbi:PfkB family carbohydrate kinase [Lacisediminihabitans sp.]|jgi:sugar/nucleoside kinase (ribokinase family)|uniref:PfkB family carbohydrate kinase n=1 Tax=Lacisediminihabitans sp. TaxID=2787631 RepID=UPI002F943C9A